MERIVCGTAATISVTFDTDEAPADASGTVTVTGTGLDGTTVFTGNADAGAAGDGKYTFPVTSTHSADPDIVDVVWSGTFSSQTQTAHTTVAFVGGFYFTLGQLRAWETAVASSAAGAYPTADLHAARAWAEQRAEQIMGRSYVRSVRRLTVTCTGQADLLLPTPDVRSIRSITIDGTAVADLDDYKVYDRALAPRIQGSWPDKSEAIVIYEHGAEWVPDPIARAVATLARARAIAKKSAVPERAERWQPGESGGLFQLAMPNSRRTGIPDVDAVLSSVRVPVFG